MRDVAPLHPVERHHLDVLSDRGPIMQHAIGPRPDPAHGYCTDDVARALQVDLLHGRELGWPAVADHARRSLRFIVEAFDPTTGGFHDFRSIDGRWLDRIGSEDCQGRALLALGEVIAEGPDGPLAASATSLFELALPAARGLTALRAQASVVLACAAAQRSTRSTAAGTAGRLMAMRLLARFEGRVGSAWPWPEPRLTYENALPARALIVAGRAYGSERMVGVGLRVLDWLIDVQTSTDGHLTTIGNGWWPCGGERSRFDQQPIEATSLLLAAESAYLATDEPRFRAATELAYGWFLGANDVGVDVADPTRGAGYDGLTPDGVNTNQGAESTLMWLVALEHVRALRARPTVAPSRVTGAPPVTPHLAAAAL